jgi:mRNA-degrading endonuclease RelE of RelBE toxin-antitoxin system
VTYQVVVTATASRSLRSVPPRVIPAVIEFIYGPLALEPRRVGKPLRGELLGSFGARRGPYRIVYEIDEATQTVAILRIGHRVDVYRP